MAIINGPFNFNGSFGKMRCYFDPATGKWILAKNGGFTREQYNTLPSLKVTRENTNEFSGCSIWASKLKESLSYIGHLMHPRCFNNIVSAGKLIQRHDTTSHHGFSGIEVSKDLQAIIDIDFNVQYPFKSVVRKTCVISFSSDKKTATLNIPGFVPTEDACWVSKYYAVRFYIVIAQTSNVVYNPVTNKYEPVVSGLELLSRKVVGLWMVNNSVPTDVDLSVSLDDPAFSIPGTAVIAAVGVEFSTSSLNGEPCVMPHCGSMKIVACFIP